MKVKLTTQYNKGREIPTNKLKPIDGASIDLAKDGTAIASVEECIVGRLERAKVDFVSANGLNISGLEYFTTADGQRNYHYQEWWCVTEGV